MSDFPDWTEGVTVLPAPVTTTDFPDWTKAAAVPAGLPGSSAGGGLILWPGKWYTSLGYQSFSPQQANLGRLTACPVDIPATHTFTGLGIGVTTGGAAGAVVRLGVYADSGGVPAGLLLDAGTVATVTTSAAATITGLSLTLAAGRYWLAACAQGAPASNAFYNASTSAAYVLGFDAPCFVNQVGAAQGWTVGGVGGALPATFPTPASDVNVTATWIQA